MCVPPAAGRSAELVRLAWKAGARGGRLWLLLHSRLLLLRLHALLVPRSRRALRRRAQQARLAGGELALLLAPAAATSVQRGGLLLNGGTRPGAHYVARRGGDAQPGLASLQPLRLERR